MIAGISAALRAVIQREHILDGMTEVIEWMQIASTSESILITLSIMYIVLI